MTNSIYNKNSRFVENFPQIEKILHFGSYSKNMQTGVVHWSEGMYEILGIAPFSETPRRELLNVVDEDKEKVAKAVAESKEHKQNYQIEFSITDNKGAFKRLYAENFLIFDEEGNIKEYNGILNDITDRYLIKLDLEQKVQLLNKSNEALKDFAYAASHDLHEPLRKILTFIDRVNEKYSRTFNEELKSYCDRINKSAVNMQSLLNDLLNFSRVSASTLQSTYATVNLSNVLDEVLSDLDIRIEESGCIINKDVSHQFQAIPSQLHQVFSNLIGNAIKFRKQNQPCKIDIKSEWLDAPSLPLTSNTKYVKVSISDNGIGFDPMYSDKIFQVFQRLHGKAEYQGSGIGLAICKKAMENHNGRIYAEGLPGQGAIFTLIFPQKQN